MQIVETANQGLKRAYTVKIPAKEIEARIDAEIKKVAPQVRMPGFRPGKVPANLIRKMHGPALHSDALNASLRDSIDTLMREKKLRPALQPKIDLSEGYEQGRDAELKVEVEVLPEIETPSIDGLKLERLTVAVTDEALDEALQKLAANQKTYTEASKTKKAADGDQVIIDFVGRIGGEPFEGGRGEDVPLVLGSGMMIPGFEAGILGAKAGETRTVEATFPEGYTVETFSGKKAEFEVTVKQVKVAGDSKVDEDFAKSLGLDGLDKLKELVSAQLERETEGLTRTQMKRQLLDTLAAAHDFEVPPTMVEAEFAQIWQQLEAEIAREEDPEAGRKEIEAEKDDYKRIAERRVRLGLLLSEIGQANGVEVTQQEMGMLLQQAAQQYRPEDRERFIEYVRSEPMAQAQLRAPLYEDKVVDFLFGKAEVTERQVTREELEAAIEAEDTAPTPAPKKAAAKKPTAKKSAGEAPAKKTAAKVDADKPAARKAAPKKAAAEVDAKPAAKKAAAKKPAAKK
jgi:trigger factor